MSELRHHNSSLDRSLFAASLDIHEGEVGAFALRFDRNHVLILFSPNLQLDDIAFVVALAAHIALTSGVVARTYGEIAAMGVGVAFDHMAELLQLILIKGEDFVGCVVGFILDGNDFHAKKAAGDVYVGALAIAVLLRLLASAEIG